MSEGQPVFISYRRSDSAGHARAASRELSRRFGPAFCFFDCTSIETGDVFPDRLRQGIAACTVVLVFIGPGWAEVRGASGLRGLEDPSDFVRLEITLALQAGKAVVPILLDGTAMPDHTAMPPPLQALTTRGGGRRRRAGVDSTAGGRSAAIVRPSCKRLGGFRRGAQPPLAAAAKFNTYSPGK